MRKDATDDVTEKKYIYNSVREYVLENKATLPCWTYFPAQCLIYCGRKQRLTEEQ